MIGELLGLALFAVAMFALGAAAYAIYHDMKREYGRAMRAWLPEENDAKED